MRIGIDIDEVIAEQNEKLNDFHRDIYGINLTRSNYKNFNFHESWSCSKEEARARFKLFMESDYFKLMLPVNGSVEGIKELINMGHELIIISSRSELVYDETRLWLDKFFPTCFLKVCFAQNKTNVGKRKWEICIDEKIDLMIDDGLHVIEDCSKKGIKTIVFDNPWNRDCDFENSIRVRNWVELINVVKEL